MRKSIARNMSNPAMIVAIIALFIAMGGSAYAGSKLAKNSVTTNAIKNGAVTGKKIKKKTITATNIKSNTITGSQINEAALGSVPNADKVGGIAASDLVTNKKVITWNVPMNRGDAPKTLATFGPFTVTGRCEVNGANTDAYADITTSTDHTYAYGDSDFNVGETENWFSYTNFTPTERSFTTAEPYFLDPSTGFSILDGDGQQAGVWVGFPGADCRFVGSLIAD